MRRERSTGNVDGGNAGIARAACVACVADSKVADDASPDVQDVEYNDRTAYVACVACPGSAGRAPLRALQPVSKVSGSSGQSGHRMSSPTSCGRLFINHNILWWPKKLSTFYPQGVKKSRGNPHSALKIGPLKLKGKSGHVPHRPSVKKALSAREISVCGKLCRNDRNHGKYVFFTRVTRPLTSLSYSILHRTT